VLRIGDLSQRAGVAPSAVRYYERIGLLPAPTREDGGQRRYDEAAIARLRKIEQLKALGLSLEEIAGVIDLYFQDPTARKAKLKVVAILRRHLAEAEQKLEALEQFRADLQAHIQRFELWLDLHGDDT
jgi:MerR family copper efflux transcriptional regulator